jgi:hypothetical protein
MSEDELHVKVLLKNGQVQNEVSFISHLDVYLETQEGFLSLFFLV